MFSVTSIKEVVFGKASWGYFVDIRGDSPDNFSNVGIYQYKKEAKKIAREKAQELNVPLLTDWGNETLPPSCLDSILQMMGSKQPMRRKPIKTKGVEQSDWLTKSGWQAYDRLIALLYGIGTVCEVNVDKIIEKIDYLVDSDSC